MPSRTGSVAGGAVLPDGTVYTEEPQAVMNYPVNNSEYTPMQAPATSVASETYYNPQDAGSNSIPYGYGESAPQPPPATAQASQDYYGPLANDTPTVPIPPITSLYSGVYNPLTPKQESSQNMYSQPLPSGKPALPAPATARSFGNAGATRSGNVIVPTSPHVDTTSGREQSEHTLNMLVERDRIKNNDTDGAVRNRHRGRAGMDYLLHQMQGRANQPSPVPYRGLFGGESPQPERQNKDGSGTLNVPVFDPFGWFR